MTNASHSEVSVRIAEHAGRVGPRGLRAISSGMETQKRRSRMHRVRTGKRLELTARDLEIFRLLTRYRFLRSSFIHAFVGGTSEKRFKERLGHLYHEGNFLDRPRQQWEFANSRYRPAVYEIGQRARAVLQESGNTGCGLEECFDGAMVGSHRQFAHTLMICEVLASIELAVRNKQELRLIGRHEILAKAPPATRRLDNPLFIPVAIPRSSGVNGQSLETGIMPDGIFGLEYENSGRKSYRFFALEADRNTMPVFRSTVRQTSYARKILAYKEIIGQHIYKLHLGLPNLLVLTVTTNERHMRQIAKAAGELSGGSPMFLFKTCPALDPAVGSPVPAPEILSEPWQRAGFSPLRIDLSV
jgi:hypothetical protein